MADKRGRFYTRIGYRQDLQSELLWHYVGNDDFLNEWLDLWRKHTRVIRALVTNKSAHVWQTDQISFPNEAWRNIERVIYPSGGGGSSGQGPVRHARPLRHFELYLSSLFEFAWRWGLRANWAP